MFVVIWGVGFHVRDTLTCVSWSVLVWGGKTSSRYFRHWVHMALLETWPLAGDLPMGFRDMLFIFMWFVVLFFLSLSLFSCYEHQQTTVHFATTKFATFRSADSLLWFRFLNMQGFESKREW